MKIDVFDVHPGVIWVDEVSKPKAVQQIMTSISGNISIAHGKILKPEMTFEAKDTGGSSRGYFTREVVEFLMAAEANLEQFQIEYRGIQYTVIVPAGGVRLEPKRETEGISYPDPYSGTVTVQVI